MTTLLTSDLIDRIHSAAKAKGFWDDANPDAGQFIMLTIGELGECQEAHRKGIAADIDLYNACLEKVHHLAPELWPEGEARAFKECIKDSVEDELADAYIRLCDIIGGFGIEIPSVEELALGKAGAGELPANFGACLLEITTGLTELYQSDLHGDYAAGSAVAMELLAQREGIDLAKHIELKLAYNLSRPVRHGKDY